MSLERMYLGYDFVDSSNDPAAFMIYDSKPPQPDAMVELDYVLNEARQPVLHPDLSKHTEL